MTPAAHWTFSPDPAVEAAVADVAAKYPPLMPAGLQRFEGYLKALGDPHLHLPPVFHAAGTNGKGSTLAFLQAALEAGGKSVHKFTSPHLVRFEERIVLNGKNIGGGLLLGLIAECNRAAAGYEVSFFEFFTALAFLAFSRTPADAVLLETGLGGLLDATNVVERSIAVLTRISLDHTHILGGTLPEIAAQKAGIIKRGCPAVTAPQPGAGVMEVFEKQAAAMDTALFRDWRVSDPAGCGLPLSPCGKGGFVYESAAFTFHLPLPALAGAHQVVNAGTAIAALSCSPFSGLLKQDVLAAAMRTVSWAGRMQRITRGPVADLLPPGWEIWLDGAHNDSGAEVLAAQAKEWGAASGGPLFLVTAMKFNKGPDDFYGPLAPFVTAARVLDADIGAPMMAAPALCDYIRKAGIADVAAAGDLESAVSALTSQGGSAGRILIAGSLYLAGYVLRTHS